MAYDPCDHCKMFDVLMYPRLLCTACLSSGRYEQMKREGEYYETNGKA